MSENNKADYTTLLNGNLYERFQAVVKIQMEVMEIGESEAASISKNSLHETITHPSRNSVIRKTLEIVDEASADYLSRNQMLAKTVLMLVASGASDIPSEAYANIKTAIDSRNATVIRLIGATLPFATNDKARQRLEEILSQMEIPGPVGSTPPRLQFTPPSQT